MLFPDIKLNALPRDHQVIVTYRRSQGVVAQLRGFDFGDTIGWIARDGKGEIIETGDFVDNVIEIQKTRRLLGILTDGVKEIR